MAKTMKAKKVLIRNPKESEIEWKAGRDGDYMTITCKAACFPYMLKHQYGLDVTLAKGAAAKTAQDVNLPKGVFEKVKKTKKKVVRIAKAMKK